MGSTSPAARFAPMFPDPARRRAAIMAWLTMATDDDLYAALGVLTDARLRTISAFADGIAQDRLADRHQDGRCGGCSFCPAGAA